MIRIIEYKTYKKDTLTLGVIKSIDTLNGEVYHYDFSLGEESAEILELKKNYEENGILEDYSQYLPPNPKILKDKR